ncbi:MAG: trigger factor, partial [Bacillota bacterium]
QGLDVDDYLSYMGMDEEDWRDNNYEAAANRARNNLILEKIAEEEGIEADEEEVDSKIAEIAGRNDQDPEQVRALLQMQGQLENLKQSIKMEKVLDFLKENN